MVLSLRKAGVEFDAIEAKAEELGDTLKTLDAPRVKDLSDTLSTAKKGTDDLTDSARGANSAMANMVGNATQDLGALGGVAGSAGVAIGQMAEYAADATFAGEGLGSALGSMAKVAGPIAVLSGGLAIATKLFGDFQKRQQEVAENTRETAEAMAEITGAATELEGALESIGATAEDFGDLLLASLGPEKLGDAVTAAHQLGIDFTELGDIIAGLGDAGDLDGFNLLVESIQENLGLTREQAIGVAEAVAEAGSNFGLIRNILVGNTDLTRQQIDAMEDQLMLYGRIGDVAEDTDINEVAQEQLDLLDDTVEGLNLVLEARDRLAAQGILDPSAIQVATEVYQGNVSVARSLDDINTALDAQAGKLRVQDALWGAIIRDLTDEDGLIGTADGAAAAYAQLQNELGLTDAEMDALVQNKLDEHMADIATAEEEAEQKARDFAQAVADLGDVIADIDADDISNIGDALAEGLELGGVAVDLQVEEAELRGQVDEITKDIQDFVDEHGAVDWSVVLDPTASAEGFDAGLAGMIADLQDQFQTGIVNAFESGGTDAAVAFIAEFGPKLAALGLTPAQVKEFMGIPADGSIPLFLQLQIDAEAKADALAILNSIQGVNPDDPIAAYLALQVQTGAIDPVIAEIVALLLAQSYGINVDAKLAEFTPDQLAAAQAQLDATDYTAEVEVEADTAPADDAIGGVEDGDYQAQIDAVAETADAAQQLLDEASRHRTATIYALADFTAAKTVLDGLDDPRTAPIVVDLRGEEEAERVLDLLDNPRTVVITTRNVSTAAPTPALAPSAAGWLSRPRPRSPPKTVPGWRRWPRRHRCRSPR